MISKSSVTKVIYSLSYKYISVFTYLTNLLFTPVTKLLSKFSPSLSEGVSEIKNPLKNFLATLPIFILIVFSGTIIFNDENIIYNNLYELIQIDNIATIGFILMFGVGLLYGLLNIKNNDLKTRIVITVIICSSGVPLLFLNPPQLYVYMLTLLYSIGAYTTTFIKFETDVDKITQHIDDKTGVIDYVHIIAYIAVIFSLLISINFISLFNSINPLEFTSSFVFVLTLLLGISAYGFTKIQQHTYDEMYKHTHLNKSSRFYLFPSRIAIVYATTSIIVSQNVTIVSGILFFIPAIMYVKFLRHIRHKKDLPFGEVYTAAVEHNNNTKGIIKAQNGLKPKVNNIDFNHCLSDNGGAKLEMDIAIEIPGEQQDSYNRWKYFLQTMHNVNDIINNLQNVDNNNVEKIEEYDEFYTRASKIGAENMVNSSDGPVEFPFENWPDKLSNNIIRQMYTIDEYNMDDIVNATITRSEKNRIDDINDYADKFD